MRRGVSKEIIDKTLSERDENAEMEGALKAGRAYLKGRSFKDERDARAKLFQALARRGFDYDIVSQAAESLLEEEGEF